MAAFDPGLSLARLLDPAVLANPYPSYSQLREEAPVYFDPFLHTWVVSRYADVLKVLLTFSADLPWRDNLGRRGLNSLPVTFSSPTMIEQPRAQHPLTSVY